MCYTGSCKYENHEGECCVKAFNMRKGLPKEHYPDDAACIKAEREIEKLDRAIHEIKEEDLLQNQ